MKRFSFPLERVLGWREEQARVEELKLEQLRAQAAALDQQKRDTALGRARSEWEVLSQRVVEATELANLDSYRLHAREKIRDLEQRVRQTEAQAAEQLQRVLQARRQAELLERLKQKALEEWRAANNREQEALAAELYLANRGRNARASRLR